MIILKFIGWIFIITFGLILFLRIFGRPIMRYLMKILVKRAQADLDRQSKIYEEYVHGHSPFEDNIYVDDNVKVSVKRGDKEAPKKKEIDPSMIETVDFEDVD